MAWRAGRAGLAAGWALRLGLAGLFGYAGALKLADPATFAADVANYHALPDQLVPAVAVFVPVLELVVAAALLWSPYARGGAIMSAAMLAVFAVAMGQAKLRGIDLECGCFGQGSTAQVSWLKVAQNLGLAGFALWLALALSTRAGMREGR